MRFIRSAASASGSVAALALAPLKPSPISSLQRQVTFALSVMSFCGRCRLTTSGMVTVSEKMMRAPSSEKSRTRQLMTPRRLSK